MAKCQYCDSTDVLVAVVAEPTDSFVPSSEHEILVCRDCGRTSVGEERGDGGLFG